MHDFEPLRLMFSYELLPYALRLTKPLRQLDVIVFRQSSLSQPASLIFYNHLLNLALEINKVSSINLESPTGIFDVIGKFLDQINVSNLRSLRYLISSANHITCFVEFLITDNKGIRCLSPQQILLKKCESQHRRSIATACLYKMSRQAAMIIVATLNIGISNSLFACQKYYGIGSQH